ncbi:MAG: 16S rRNA (cytidine(1402)-2'-O)-methyltransferase [Prochloraceae cyanobacterium]|nr:16S rRNA (cytidine(1402)-2'-O)-methyltransferase [Prochloraceae cyanobacterium]
MSEEIKPGILYIVGTPIGNLDDITFRAINTLKTVDLIAAEDTRHTGKLLEHFQIDTPQISYHENNRASRHGELLERLGEGKSIALVSDAGMPGISDPGYDLVKLCVERGISIVPIPGVTAAITALAASGLPTDRFVFEGFLTTKSKLRSALLESLAEESRTIILYESPHRLRKTLKDLREALGKERAIVVARELTKLYEEIWRGTIEKAVAHFGGDKPLKGEFTLIIGGTTETKIPTMSDEEVKEELKKIMKQGVSRSQASKQLAQRIALSRRRIYELALEI